MGGRHFKPYVNNQTPTNGGRHFKPQDTNPNDPTKIAHIAKWGRHFKPPHFVTDKPTDMEVKEEATNYMEVDPTILMLREGGTYWEPPAIVEAKTELKNWAWEGATHPMEDSVRKIKIVKSVTFTKKINTAELASPTKSIVVVPIDSVSANVSILVNSVCDSFPVKSVEYVKNSFPFNMISNSAYLLALNVFISKIGKETLNNKELKQGYLEPIKEETQPIDLGTDDEPKMIQVGNILTALEKDALVALLTEFKEIVAWSYQDMPGIDIDIVQHYIPTDPTMKPVKQKFRKNNLEWTFKIKEEVEKQYNAGFLRVVNYPEGLANVVLIPKKDGKVEMCVDFRELNKANPKDDFLLPHINVLVDNTMGHALRSFMDG